MIVEEAFAENLVRHFSDVGYKIRQIETNAIYDEAIDVIPCRYTYEETDERVDDDSTIEDKAEAYDILMGVDE